MAEHAHTAEAYDPLSSVEELDHVMYVVSSRSWLGLLTVCLLLAGAVSWGFIGSVSTKIAGQGILIESGALFNIVTVSPGQILEMAVTEGQAVSPGTVVARLAQPEIEADLREEQSLLAKLKQERAFIESEEKTRANLEYQYVDQQQRTLEESIRMGSEHVKETRELVEFYKDLRIRGTVSRLDLEKWKGELRQAEIQLLKDRQQLLNLDLMRHKTDTALEQKILDLMKTMVPVEERAQSLKERLNTFSEVRSIHSGVIVEIHRNRGDVLRVGDSVATMELNHRERDPEATSDAKDTKMRRGNPLAVAYVPPFQGTSIRPKMSVQVIPESVSEDEFGVMLGQVESVSRYPASPQGMMRVLDNQELVDMLTHQGAPVMITVSLQEAPENPSGYRWSSGLGPPTPIESGTQCVVKVITRTQTPIDLIIPYLTRLFQGHGTGPVAAGEPGHGH